MREIGNSNSRRPSWRRRTPRREHRRHAAVRLRAEPVQPARPRRSSASCCPSAERLGIGFLPYFPLANGLFTGKFTRTERPADTRIARQRPHVADDAPWDAIEAYAAFCAERGIAMLEATLGWFLAEPALSSVIAGATRPEQVRQNAAAGSGWRPDADELAIDRRALPAASGRRYGLSTASAALSVVA